MAYLTPEGLKQLQKKIETLKQKRNELQARRAEAYVMGGDGWHDNPEFESIEAEDKRISQEIFRLQEELAKSETATKTNTLTIGIGSKVEIEFSDGSRKKFEIGDGHTADPSAGIISFESPLGKALIGATPGETRCYVVNGNQMQVTIKNIS